MARARSARDSGAEGLLVVDKPAGWTSHDVVGRVRRLSGTRRVGHAGTLDPMATGVLLLGLGRATRLLGHLALTDKDYDATVRLGVATVTDDAEGEVTQTADRARLLPVTDDEIEAAVARLRGPILQVPSTVSAIKVDGQRAYARVRSGEDVELAARPVTVSRFDVRDIRRSEATLDVDVSVTCSSGTYVRALARDVGVDLGVGGHLTALRRTRVGPYPLSMAVPLPEPAAGEEGHPRLPLLSLTDAVTAAFPRREVDAERARLVRHGGRLAPAGLGPGPVGVFGPDNELLALVEEDEQAARPLVVFAATLPA
ncbi:MAG: tRNA pseudouridine(55) synthase TruB [Actinomycetales bacterium]